MIDSIAAIIGGGAEVSSANALTEGVSSSSTQHSEANAVATISFVGNTAFVDGGAILLTYPAGAFIRGVKFASNEAMFGGAVSLVSTAESSVDFELCEFESNNATRGGALHLTGEGQSFVRDSSFYQNVAAETGGALFNAGPLEAHGTDFAENVAGDNGLAIHNGDTDELVLRDVTFSDNLLRCPPEEYNTDDTSSSSCRFEIVCAQCMDGCDSDLANVTIRGDKPPVCEAIPEGVQPSSSVTTIETFIIEQGYYRVSSSSSIVLECYQKDACVGGPDASNYCETGYMGPYCAVCVEGFAPGTSSRCHKCSGDNRGLTAGLAITFLVAVLVVALLVASYLLAVDDGGEETGNEARRSWRRKLSAFHNAFVKAVPLSAVSIVVVVLQIVIQFSDIAGSVYPQEYEEFLSKLAIVNVDIGFMLSNACILSTNFYDRLIFATISPLVILLACACTFLIASSRVRTRNSSTAEAILKQKHLSVVLFVIFFVYSFVSFTVLQTFVCDPLDDGKAYLRADYSITCYTATYTAYKTYASFMVCVYPIGVPAFFGWWLVRNRRELEKPGRQSVSDLQSYRFLWAAYRPACYYYEVVECTRRIVLTGAAVFVLPDTAEQVAIVLLLAVIFMFISESLSPFESKLDMWLYRWGNGIILASMYVALLLKVDLAVEGTRSSSAMTALLIVANVFMFFTVIVQAALLVRAVYAPRILKERAAVAGWSQRWIVRAAAQEEEEGLDGQLELYSINGQQGRTSEMAWPREPYS